MAETAELTSHSLAKRLPGWSKEDARFIALVEDMRENGIRTPWRVDREGHVLEDQDVLKAAKQLQIRQVPVIRTEEEPAAAIVGALVHRKHYSKGALAYVCYPLLKDAHAAALRRRIQNLKKGEARSSTESTIGKTEDFCESLGFGRDQFFKAKQAHEIFDKRDKEIAEWEAANPAAAGLHAAKKANSMEAKITGRPEDLRAIYEPKLLNGEMALGAMLAGIGGLEATKGKPREDYGQLELFSEAWETLEKRFVYWNKMGDAEKNMIAPRIRKVVEGMPADLRKEFAKALKAAEAKEAK